MPLLNPTMLFVLITDVIGSFQVFDTLYVLTRGGPGDSTKVMSLTIYTSASPITGWGRRPRCPSCCSAVILIFSVGQFMYFKKRTTYDYSA